MDYEAIVKGIVEPFGWTVEDTREFIENTDEIIIFSTEFGAKVSFFIEKSADGEYRNSYWMLTTLGEPLFYEEVEAMMKDINHIWFDIEDALI